MKKVDREKSVLHKNILRIRQSKTKLKQTSQYRTRNGKDSWSYYRELKPS